MRIVFIGSICIVLASLAMADFNDGLEAYGRGDYAGAVEEWGPLANEGQIEAQYNLGLIHSEGKGVPVDATKAHRWFLAAAEQGFTRAQYRVAEMYESGDGVTKSLVLAHMWYNAAKAQKYQDSKKRKRRVADQMTPHEIAESEMLTRDRRRKEKESK